MHCPDSCLLALQGCSKTSRLLLQSCSKTALLLLPELLQKAEACFHPWFWHTDIRYHRLNPNCFGKRVAQPLLALQSPSPSRVLSPSSGAFHFLLLFDKVGDILLHLMVSTFLGSCEVRSLGGTVEKFVPLLPSSVQVLLIHAEVLL